MGKHFTLTAADSHQLGAYRADPAGAPKGGIVVIQEIFGVNQHIRKVCDRLRRGRLRRGRAGAVRPHAEGFPVRLHAAGDREVAHLRRQARLGRDAARHRRRHQGASRRVGPIAIVGFCMGGSIAFLAATRLSGLSAAVAYYGGAIVEVRRREAEVPGADAFRREGRTASRCPTSRSSSRSAAATARSTSITDAGHGFHCDERGSFHKDSSRPGVEARQRTSSPST